MGANSSICHQLWDDRRSVRTGKIWAVVTTARSMLKCFPRWRRVRLVTGTSSRFLSRAASIHATQAREAARPLTNEQGQYNLGVAVRARRHAIGDERAPEFAVIVDLAIEHNNVTSARGDHRLVTGGRQIHDRKPAVHEGSARVGILALVVGAAMAKMPLRRCREAVVSPTQGPGNAAHQPLSTQTAALSLCVDAAGAGGISAAARRSAENRSLRGSGGRAHGAEMLECRQGFARIAKRR